MKNNYKIKNEVEIDFLEIDIDKLTELQLKTKKKEINEKFGKN